LPHSFEDYLAYEYPLCSDPIYVGENPRMTKL
jgi:hypothetical protein